MENLDLLWDQLEAAPVQRLALETIKRDERLQVRSEGATDARDVGPASRDSNAHVARLRAILDADAEADLAPILVAEVNGALLIIDGFHRHAATRLARRSAIPARVQRMSLTAAWALSKRANVGNDQLPLTQSQRREALWQYLAHITDRGRRPTSKADSFRKLKARFGVHTDTIASMKRNLPSVRSEGYAASECDPLSGLPYWRVVTARLRDRYGQPDGTPQGEKVHRLAAKLSDLIQRHGLQTYVEASRAALREAGAPDEFEPESNGEDF